MKEYIKSEFYRAMFSKNAAIGFLLTLGSLVVAFLEFTKCYIYGIDKHMYDSVYIFTKIRYATGASILVLIAPLIATLIFSDSYLLDKESGTLKFIYLRMSKKKYIWIKILVNAIVSGIVISLASLVMFFILVSLYGVSNGVPNITLYSVEGPFSSIYYKNKFLYAMLLIGVSFIFNAIFATLALGVSPWIKNRYLTFIVPFFYYIISGTILPNRLNASFLFTLHSSTTVNSIIIYQFCLFLFGIILFYFGVMWNDENSI